MKRSSSKKPEPERESDDEGSGWSAVQAYATEQQDLKQRTVQHKVSKSSFLPEENAPLSAEPGEIPGRQADQDDWETSSDEDDHTDDEHTAPKTSEQTPLIPKLAKRTLPQRALDYLRDFHLTAVQKNVLKCAVSYLLASLFTFVPALSKLVGLPFDKFGPVSNAHFIATISTYYNPAKSIVS